jgi:hypothetical protein
MVHVPQSIIEPQPSDVTPQLRPCSAQVVGTQSPAPETGSGT